MGVVTVIPAQTFFTLVDFLATMKTLGKVCLYTRYLVGKNKVGFSYRNFSFKLDARNSKIFKNIVCIYVKSLKRLEICQNAMRLFSQRLK